MNSQASLDIMVASAGCVAIALHWVATGLGIDGATVFKGVSVAASVMSAGFAVGSFRTPRGR
jgi:hypothetical protein